MEAITDELVTPSQDNTFMFISICVLTLYSSPHYLYVESFAGGE